MDFKYKPLYLECPILQIAYVIFWIPIGLFTADILSSIIVTIVFRTLELILSRMYPLSYKLFVLSGRMDAMVEPYYFIAMLFVDFVLLIIGLEIINYFISKKRLEGGFDENSIDEQN